MTANDTPPRNQVEIVEVSREELLRQRAALLDRIDDDVRNELEQGDFLLGDTPAAPVAAAETSPRMTAEQQVRMLQDVMASQAAHIAAITEALGLSHEADTDEVVAAIRAHVAAPVAGDPTAARLDAVWAALGDLGLPVELLGRVYAALVLVPPTEADMQRGREIAALLAAHASAASSTDTTQEG